MRVRPSVIIRKDDKILLMEYNYGKDLVLGIPGGNPESKETMRGTVVREVFEELGIKIVLENLICVGDVIIDELKEGTVHMIFSGSIEEGSPNLNPDETTAKDLQWVDIEQLDSLNLYPNIGKELKNYLLSGKSEEIYLGRIDQHWF